MTIWRKTKTYLGLGPDEDYMDSGDPMGQTPPQQRPALPQQPSVYPGGEPGSGIAPSAFSGASVRTIPSATAQQPPEQTAAPAEEDSFSGTQQPKKASAVRKVPASSLRAKPEVVAPRSFNDAQRVADTFKANKAVIVNLQAVSSDLSRRIIDFAAGLCYGLGGQMEKVTQAVYMLTPDDVEVSAEDRRDVEQGLS